MNRIIISVVTGGIALILMRALSAGLESIDPTAPAAELLTLSVQSAVLGLGVLVAAWYFLTSACVLVIAAARLAGQAPTRLESAVSRFGAPLLRRAATWTAISALSFATPALADPYNMDTATAPAAAVEDNRAVEGKPAVEGNARNSAFLVDLGWAPAPEPVPEPEPAPEPAPESQAPPAGNRGEAADSASEPPASSGIHVVAPGDTLWAIAARDLQNGSANATDADIAAHWPAWYAANRATIGPDPDLIHPGMTLHAPTQETP